MFNVLDYVLSTKKYSSLMDELLNDSNKNICLLNATANVSKMLASFALKRMDKNIIYICENTYEASRTYELLSNIVGDKALFYPVEEFISSDLVASSTTFKIARMMTLNSLSNNQTGIVITTLEGYLKHIMSKKRIRNSVLRLKKGQIFEINDLVKQLYNRGYKKQSTCDEAGSFAKRGYVLDIYPINSDHMIRLSYFDDEIESIKIVDVETQRSIESIDSIDIYPLYDIYYEEEDVDEIIKNIKKDKKLTEKVEKDIYRIKNYEELDQINLYLSYIDNDYTTLVELCNDPIVIYEDIKGLLNHEKSFVKAIDEYLTSIEFEKNNLFFEDFISLIKKCNKNILCAKDALTSSIVKLDLLKDLHTISNFDYNNNLQNLNNDLKINDKTVIVTHFDTNKTNYLKEVFFQNSVPFYEEDKVLEGKINLIATKDAIGFKDLDLNLEIITPYEFQAGKINRSNKYQKYYKQSTKIYSKDDIYPGDYVIHQEYGIGRYLGIEQRTKGERINDYLSVEYKDNQKLLIPVENIYLLEKYNVSEGVVPKLNSLNGKEWSKKKAKIKDELYDVAKKLIRVQEERKMRKGYIYSRDTEEQIQFEKDFPYKETIDQIKAIKEVKDDMESPHPLDRLICGDVGFGKTEVAMRAAFKAVMDNKQVTYLAPTTVLTRQHYHTFKERLDKYGIRVELLNRFVPSQKQKLVIEGLKKGTVDIVIGTHRVLSDDIQYKDLGLLIIDEEQRFGVMHKEKIKMLKSNVDVLTLTATPIPRTLQMSLNGLKDLSIIETPPVNRLPVQTYVLEHNESVIREAINREISRGGQVFYLMNRIDDLERYRFKLNIICPNARIGMIHGKLDKNLIEDELVRFLDKEYDVLLCTTIIETGIDIPNANTIIIDRADILGLSQLYQIRGRVGRSDRISYAYLMYNQSSTLTDEARKRLNAIKEFTALGSGYKIAMRDLAIRGAGDILGEKQSGFINSVGLEVYNQLLTEVINELNGVKEETKEEIKPNYRIDVSKHIDDIYIPDEDIRIYAHKEINQIRSREQLNEIISEFKDRFGKIPKDVIVYMNERYLNFLLKLKGVDIYKDDSDSVVIKFSKTYTDTMNFKQISSYAKDISKNFEFGYKEYCLWIYIKKDKEDNYIFELINFLEKI